MKNVLVTGGAGYIGSHACKALKAAGYTPVTFDNLITGTGFSVREVMDKAEEVTGRKVPCTEGPRRAGDCTKLVSGSTRAITDLGWQPKRSSLETMIADAWAWHQSGHYEH